MNDETEIQLSGPFSVQDEAGLTREIASVRIFDEGYGVIDVYVHLKSPIPGNRLFDDAVFIKNIIKRLRTLGYEGPDFGHGDLGLQDDGVLVLEAPEEFNVLAKSRGWRDLALEFDDHGGAADDLKGLDPASDAQLGALLRKFSSH